MVNRLILFAIILAMVGCSVPQRTEVSRDTLDMNLLKTHYPQLYEQYLSGQIVIDDIYPDKRIYPSGIGVEFHYVDFIANGVRPK